jgi:hypothetical protein
VQHREKLEVTQLIYHSPSSPTSLSPFDAAMLSVAEGRAIKITTPYVGLSYLKRLIGVSTEWRLISDVQAWLGSVNRTERSKAWSFIMEHISLIHHFPDLHAKTVISTHRGFLGSANLTASGILGRTEMGVLVEDEGGVRQMNLWFDELWAMSEPPSVEEGERLIQSLDLLPIADKSVGSGFTSNAIRVRARLSDKKAKSVFAATQTMPTTAPTESVGVKAHNHSNTKSAIPDGIPLPAMGEFMTRLVMALEFDTDKPMPDAQLLIKLTGIAWGSIGVATTSLIRAEFIMKGNLQNDQATFRLNDGFEWSGEWLNFYKVQDLWETKIDHLSKNIETPKIMVSSASSPSEEDPDVIVLEPGKDHSYSTNIEFADAIYTKLCHLMQENGGMLPITSASITVAPKFRLASLLSESKAIGHDHLTSAIAVVLDGKAKGIPSSPFQCDTWLDNKYESIKNIFNEPSYVSVALRHPVNPKVFPKAAKAFHNLRSNHLGPNLPIITDRQSIAIDSAYLNFAKDAAGIMIPEDALDTIYKTIGILAQAHANKIPHKLGVLKELIAIESKLDQSIINQAFHSGSMLQPKLFHIVGDERLSICGFRNDLLPKYPKSMEVFNTTLVDAIENMPQPICFTSQGISIPKGRKAIGKRDRHYAEILQFMQANNGLLTIGNPNAIGAILCKNKKGATALFKSILMNEDSSLPKAIYFDAGFIQKGMTFAFLNGMLSERDWELLPLTKKALDMVGRSNLITLKPPSSGA